MVVKNNLKELRSIFGEIEKISREHGFSDDLCSDLCLCLDEVFSNIIKFAWDDDKEHDIEILFNYDPGLKKFTITISDDGKPFNPLEAETPDLPLDLLEREIGGLGVLIVSNIMTNIEYKRLGNKNTFEMIKDVE